MTIAPIDTRRLLSTARRQPVTMRQAELVEAARLVRLLGRGGAGFPVAVKLAALTPGPDVVVLANGSESEPASWKDRLLMRHHPHAVLDGLAVCASALGTARVSIAIDDEQAAAAVRAALGERRDLDGAQVVRTRHRFVAGEVRALIRGLDGGPAVPPGVRVLPHEHGLGGRPTFASNVETFAQIGLLAALGPREYAALGDPAEPGTTLVTVHGDVPQRGVVEVPTGTPLVDLVGEGPGPVLIGGYHGSWVADASQLTLSRPVLAAAGAPLGAGVLARLPQETCALGEVARVAGWLAAQSAGQCGPCVFGLPGLDAELRELLAGRTSVSAVLAKAGLLPGRGACAHPDGTARFVRSALTAMPDELAAHEHRGCGRRVLGVLPLTGGAR